MRERINYETRERKIFLQKWRIMSHGEEEDRLDCVFFFSKKNILK